MQPVNSKWRFDGIVLAWWLLGYVVWLSLSLHHNELLVCSSALFSVFFAFPQDPLKLSVPDNNYMFPRGSPNIQGIRRHLACKSLFLSLTLCIALYFPLSSSLSVLSASQQYKRSVSSVSLWFQPRWSHSFFLQPPHLPAHLIDQFLVFLCLMGQWYITKYKAGPQLMITFITD